MSDETNNGKFQGTFSLGYMSLKIQLESLLAECGGKKASDFLDALSNLPDNKRDILLDTFSSVIKKVIENEAAPALDGDAAVKDFENCVYQDLMASMKQAALSANRFGVVDGGKCPKRVVTKAPISLDKVRKAKREGSTPFMN